MAVSTQSSVMKGNQLVARSSVARAPRARFSSTIRAAVTLKDPPYPLDALEPHISKSTLEFHWGKHQAAYVNNLNGQIKDTDLDKKSLEEIVLATWNNGSPSPAFNNAAQVWNHEFYWEGIKPNGGGKPTGAVAKAIDAAFGSYDEFVKQFKQAGATQFGSGWAWLVTNKNGEVSIVKTPNAENPITTGVTPILTMDVWEHAYYLDYQNKRPDYMTTFVDKLINWGKVEERYQAATK